MGLNVTSVKYEIVLAGKYSAAPPNFSVVDDRIKNTDIPAIVASSGSVSPTVRTVLNGQIDFNATGVSTVTFYLIVARAK